MKFTKPSTQSCSSIRLPLVHKIKMGVLMLIGIDGKVKIAKYQNSLRAIEPIYLLLELIFIVQHSRKHERVLAYSQFAI